MQFQSTHPRRVRRRPFSGSLRRASFNPRTRAGCDSGWEPTTPGWRWFQSTHPRRVRPSHCAAGRPWPAFQSTHPRRVRLGSPVLNCAPHKCFNPRTRAGCDLSPAVAGCPCSVSIHAPAQGATLQGRRPMVGSSRFNPRTRAGCDPHLSDTQQIGQVSIHAPAQGATPSRDGVSMSAPVSIHAPAQGATSTCCISNLGRTGFNPRTRAGCDPTVGRPRSAPWLFQSTHPRRVRRAGAESPIVCRDVSIHAPAQGATVEQCICITNYEFQSTHPRRVRPRLSICRFRSDMFQSTHPRRVRPRGARNATDGALFQSTHPRRVRRATRHDVGRTLQVSIHAPAQGATHRAPGFSAPPAGFNPRTRAGCDPPKIVPAPTTASFNPRTRAGCDCLHVNH